MAFDLLKDIWTLPRSTNNIHPGFQTAREALWILGKLLFHMVFPYLCVDLSLSEQVSHFSAAAHLALTLFKLAGKEFILTTLYINLIIMVKNILFVLQRPKSTIPMGGSGLSSAELTGLKSYSGFSEQWLGMTPIWTSYSLWVILPELQKSQTS